MIRLINSSDQSNFLSFSQHYNSDFYHFAEGRRNFLTDMKVAKKVFNSCIKHGDTALVHEEQGQIIGVALLLREDQKFLKVLGQNSRIIENLFQVLLWKNPTEFFVRVKKNNFLYRICTSSKYRFDEVRKFGFKFEKNSGKESIFKYIPNPVKYKMTVFKGDD